MLNKKRSKIFDSESSRYTWTTTRSGRVIKKKKKPRKGAEKFDLDTVYQIMEVNKPRAFFLGEINYYLSKNYESIDRLLNRKGSSLKVANTSEELEFIYKKKRRGKKAVLTKKDISSTD